jgi:hypothetical protein
MSAELAKSYSELDEFTFGNQHNVPKGQRLKKIIFSPELFSLLAGSSFVVGVALSYTQI